MKGSKQVVTKPLRGSGGKGKGRSHGYALPEVAQRWAAAKKSGGEAQ